MGVWENRAGEMGGTLYCHEGVGRSGMNDGKKLVGGDQIIQKASPLSSSLVMDS